MIRRFLGLATLAGTLAACAGGMPALGYGMPDPGDVRYSYGDTTVISVSMMGQSLELTQQGIADYAVAFAPAPEGVNVTMSLTDLTGTIIQPMGGPVSIDEHDVQGALVFSLDRQGNATVAEQPEVALEASQFVSGLALAHGFFPGLPDQVVAVGDTWTDTVSYEGQESAGDRSETAILHYSVAGDTTVAGRDLLRIDVEGVRKITGDVEVSGMAVTQSAEVEVAGHVLWDVEAGVMFERRTTASGSGTVSVPMTPNPIPLRVERTQTIRLREGAR
jgi:hypothetical protein